MITIKLDAIDSTNDFLKILIKKESVDNFTLVTAQSQYKGKGQRGANWMSENGKNLIMSMLIKNDFHLNQQLFDLNILVSIAIYQTLWSYKIPNLSIKWPNDIMSASKKIGGVLIENIFKHDNTLVSIVGIGINVNQIHFPNLPNASSLALVTDKNFDTEILAQDIRDKIVYNFQNFEQYKNQFCQNYSQYLFRKNIISSFLDEQNNPFNAIIIGVSKSGLIQLEDQNKIIKEFDIKQIQMIY